MSAEADPAGRLAARLADLPDVDLARALHLLNGQLPAVERVLRRVAADYAGGVPDLAAPPEGDPATGPVAARRVARACHQLRGVLSLLGATALADEAKRLEDAANADLPDAERTARAASLDGRVRSLAERLGARL
jgi:ubiquinone biosynthesis protein UbiJ